MYCSTCGSLNREDSLVCVACGAALKPQRSAIGTPKTDSGPRRLMLFIDAANIERQARDIGINRVPWHLIRDQLRGNDTLLGAFYYTGTDLRVDGFRQQLDYLVTNGFRVVHKRSKELPGGGYKGNLDIEMSLDMLDFIGHYNKAIVFTGDGDFIPVFTRLRDRGIQVVVANFGVGSDPILKMVADGVVDLGLLLSMVIENEKHRESQIQVTQPELPLGDSMDAHVDRNLLAARLYNLGRNAFERGELSQALNHFSQATKLMPRHAGYRHRLAQSLSALGRQAEALNQLEELLRLQDDMPEAYFDLGHVYEKLGTLEKAADAYNRCIALDPDNKDAQRRKLEVARLIKGVEEQEPRRVGRATGRGYVRSQDQSSEQRGRQAQESAPPSRRNGESRQRTAPVEPPALPPPAPIVAEAAAPVEPQERTQRPEKPEQRVERPERTEKKERVEFRPVAVMTAGALADALRGNRKDALQALEAAVRQESENLTLSLALAQELAAAGERVRAATLAEQLVLDNPDSYEPVVVLGRICYERGKFRDAQEQFQRAVEMVKDKADAETLGFLHRMIAWSHMEQGRPKDALAACAVGLKAAPNDEQLRRLADRVTAAGEATANGDEPAQGGVEAQTAVTAEAAGA